MSVLKGGIIGLFMCAALAAGAQGDLIDKVAAVVGNEIILQSEIEVQALQITQGQAVTDQARHIALEALMFEKLLLNQARLDSVEVSDEYIYATIDQRIQYYISLLGSEEAFEEYYGKSVTAWKDEFYDPIKEQLMAEQLKQEMLGAVDVTPGEVVDFFDGIPKDSLPLIPEELWYSQIAMDPAITAKQEADTRSLLDSIRSIVVEKPYRWNLEVVKWTQDPGSKGTNGCYRGVQKGVMVPEFEAAAFSTPIGNVSEVFETDFGYHILKVEDRRGNIYDACHILVRPEVTDQALVKAEQMLDSLVNEIRTDTLTFRNAALRYSTDEKTAKQEGRVINPASGTKRFRVDEMDPKLFFILDKLGEGEISDPFYFTEQDGSSKFLSIRLDGRLQAHTANLDDDYLIFQQQAKQFKQQEELEAWVRKRLRNTFVRIDEEYVSENFTFPWLDFQASEAKAP